MTDKPRILSSVNVGDYIAWGKSVGAAKVAKVEFVTKFHVLTRGKRWRIRDGSLVGALGWQKEYARPATDDDKQSALVRKARAMIIAASVDLSNDDAIRVAEFIFDLSAYANEGVENE